MDNSLKILKKWTSVKTGASTAELQMTIKSVFNLAYSYRNGVSAGELLFSCIRFDKD